MMRIRETDIMLMLFISRPDSWKNKRWCVIFCEGFFFNKKIPFFIFTLTISPCTFIDLVYKSRSWGAPSRQ